MDLDTDFEKNTDTYMFLKSGYGYPHMDKYFFDMDI